MRFLAIDLGEKRTGLAVGDDGTGVTTPLQTIETRNPHERMRQITRAIARQGPDALVLGLPLNMDGSEGEPARRARNMAERLRQQFGLEVHLHDERLTSHAAEQVLRERGWSSKSRKSRPDALAAATILRDFLDARKQPPG
jgi:putative Holliday junction resolvase